MGEMADDAYDRAIDELERMDGWDYEESEFYFPVRQPQSFPVIKPNADDWFKSKQDKGVKK